MLHQIGIGTLGPVFRTYEPTRDRLVSVKAFRLDIVPEQAQALAAALSRATKASLFHPSIVEPIEAGVEGTVAYRAEEYVAAESLDVAMRHYAPAPIDKVLPFITQLAGAIDFARAADIGHGGLHPRDIFVTPDEARATGFGVVEALEQVGIRAPIRRPYSAPERIDGRAWGTAADVFSLAAITFELLTGKRPSGTGAQIGALPDGEHASALQTVLARAMDDEPSRRYASALAFAGALEAASQGRRITEVVPVPVPAPMPVPPPAAPPAAPAVETARAKTIAEAQAAAELEEAEAAAAGIVEPQTAVELEPEDDDEPEIVEPADAATPPATLPVAATAGEFEVEAALGRGQKPGARTLFDDDLDVAGSTPVERSDRVSPLEDEPIYAAETSIPAEKPMFWASEPEMSRPDPDETSRSPILPYALLLVLGLLVGFAGGYFVGSRDRLPAATDTTAAVSTPQPAAPAPGQGQKQGQNRPATPEQPRQYSEQKVTPPAPPAETGTAAPPAVTRPAPRAAAPAAATKGQIVVHSVPTRAGVIVNGTWRGRTPLTLDNLAFGSYVVRVVEGGYKVARDEFTLSARDPARTFTARLELAPAAAVRGPAPAAAAPAPGPSSFTGSLYVDSRPRGAKVTIDGKSVGQTPVTVPEVTAGSHVVRIEMDGKKPVTANPRIVAGQTERVTVSLEDRQH